MRRSGKWRRGAIGVGVALLLIGVQISILWGDIWKNSIVSPEKRVYLRGNEGLVNEVENSHLKFQVSDQGDWAFYILGVMQGRGWYIVRDFPAEGRDISEEFHTVEDFSPVTPPRVLIDTSRYEVLHGVYRVDDMAEVDVYLLLEGENPYVRSVAVVRNHGTGMTNPFVFAYFDGWFDGDFGDDCANYSAANDAVIGYEASYYVGYKGAYGTFRHDVGHFVTVHDRTTTGTLADTDFVTFLDVGMALEYHPPSWGAESTYVLPIIWGYGATPAELYTRLSQGAAEAQTDLVIAWANLTRAEAEYVQIDFTLLNAGVGATVTDLKVLVDGEERQSIPIALAAGEARNYTQTVLDLTEGEHNITLYAVPCGGELITVNNRWSVVHTFSRPDLYISDVSIPPIQLGSNAINFKVKNNGSFGAENVYTVILVNGTQVAYQLIEEVAPMGAVPVSFAWTPAAIGTYNITLYVYPAVAEVERENNREMVITYMRDLVAQEIRLLNATLGTKGFITIEAFNNGSLPATNVDMAVYVNTTLETTYTLNFTAGELKHLVTDFNFTIPGVYNITVQLARLTNETDVGDNRRTELLELFTDLEVIDFALPNTYQKGKNLTFSAKIQNIGLCNATNVNVSFWVNGTQVANQTLLLVTAAPQIATFSWVCEGKGWYNFTIGADPLPLEGNVSNNRISTIVRVESDLFLDNVLVPMLFENYTLENPTNATFSLVVKNAGNLADTNVVITLFINKTAEQQVLLPFLGGLSFIPLLLNWSVPNNGTYLIEINVTQSANETDAANNAFTTTVYLFADFQVAEVQLPETYSFTVPNAIQVTLKNAGNFDGYGTTCTLYVNGTWQSEFILYDLLANSSFQFALNWTPAATGFYELVVNFTRPYGEALENITNNEWYGTQTLGVDLGIQQAWLPSTYAEKENATIEVMVRNNGNSDTKTNVTLLLFINETQVSGNQSHVPLQGLSGSLFELSFNVTELAVYHIAIYVSCGVGEGNLTDNWWNTTELVYPDLQVTLDLPTTYHTSAELGTDSMVTVQVGNVGKLNSSGGVLDLVMDGVKVYADILVPNLQPEQLWEIDLVLCPSIGQHTIKVNVTANATELLTSNNERETVMFVKADLAIVNVACTPVYGNTTLEVTIRNSGNRFAWANTFLWIDGKFVENRTFPLGGYVQEIHHLYFLLNQSGYYEVKVAILPCHEFPEDYGNNNQTYYLEKYFKPLLHEFSLSEVSLYRMNESTLIIINCSDYNTPKNLLSVAVHFLMPHSNDTYYPSYDGLTETFRMIYTPLASAEVGTYTIYVEIENEFGKKTYSGDKNLEVKNRVPIWYNWSLQLMDTWDLTVANVTGALSFNVTRCRTSLLGSIAAADPEGNVTVYLSITLPNASQLQILGTPYYENGWKYFVNFTPPAELPLGVGTLQLCVQDQDGALVQSQIYPLHIRNAFPVIRNLTANVVGKPGTVLTQGDAANITVECFDLDGTISQFIAVLSAEVNYTFHPLGNVYSAIIPLAEAPIGNLTLNFLIIDDLGQSICYPINLTVYGELLYAVTFVDGVTTVERGGILVLRLYVEDRFGNPMNGVNASAYLNGAWFIGRPVGTGLYEITIDTDGLQGYWEVAICLDKQYYVTLSSEAIFIHVVLGRFLWEVIWIIIGGVLVAFIVWYRQRTYQERFIFGDVQVHRKTGKLVGEVALGGFVSHLIVLLLIPHPDPTLYANLLWALVVGILLSGGVTVFFLSRQHQLDRLYHWNEYYQDELETIFWDEVERKMLRKRQWAILNANMPRVRRKYRQEWRRSLETLRRLYVRMNERLKEEVLAREFAALESNTYHYEEAFQDAEDYFAGNDFQEALVRYVYALFYSPLLKSQQIQYLRDQIRIICREKPVEKRVVERTIQLLEALEYPILLRRTEYPQPRNIFQRRLHALRFQQRLEERRLQEKRITLVPKLLKKPRTLLKTIHFPEAEVPADERVFLEADIGKLRKAGRRHFHLARQGKEIEFERARETYEKIRDLQVKLKDKEGLLRTFSILNLIQEMKLRYRIMDLMRQARLLRAHGQFADALEFYRDARHFASQLGDTPLLYRIASVIERVKQDLRYLSIDIRQQVRPAPLLPEVPTTYDEPLAEAAPSPHSEPEVLLEFDEFMQKIRQLREVGLLREALKTLRERRFDYPAQQIRISEEIGDLYIALEEWELARGTWFKLHQKQPTNLKYIGRLIFVNTQLGDAGEVTRYKEILNRVRAEEPPKKVVPKKKRKTKKSKRPKEKRGA